jgi:hypothetical protein
MNSICFIVLVVLFINLFISFFIKYYKINYYRKRYTNREIQEFILKFCHGCFCLSTYKPDPEMSYNVYSKRPMTKEQLQILINKLLDDGIIEMFIHNGQKSYCIISDSKSAFLRGVYKSWEFTSHEHN